MLLLAGGEVKVDNRVSEKVRTGETLEINIPETQDY